MTMSWILLFVSALLRLSLSSREEAGTQFITYNGTIAGHLTRPASAPPNCPTYYFDSLGSSFISVGVNPPWDTNPLYFDLEHRGQEVDSSRCILVGCTADPIYNLFFTTVGYLCFNNTGQLCGNIEYYYHYAPQENLDLNKATMVALDWGDGDAGKGYSIAGDQNATAPFTYALNFTNTTADARFSLAAPLGSLAFSFSGSRVDRNSPGAPIVEPYDNGNYTPIALNTSNPSKPSFQFANGSQFVWKNYSHGECSAVSRTSAAAAALSIDTSLALWSRCLCLWPLLMVATGAFLSH